MQNTPRPAPFYTGQGFPGEKLLAITAVVLTIISTVMLIKVTAMQKEQLKYNLAEIEKKKNKS